jgi:hypothetical protein
MKAAKIIGALIALAVVAGIALYWVQLQRQAGQWKDAREIVEESFNKDGGTATVRYVGIIDGPIDKVQDAVWAVEKSAEMVANIKKSELIKSEGNQKTVLMQLQALNLPLQQYTMQFTLDPAAHKVAFKTLQAQAADLEGAYVLEPSPDGKRTKLTYEAKSVDKIAVPFPAALIESANRETFVNTIRGINKMVGGAAPAAAG